MNKKNILFLVVLLLAIGGVGGYFWVLNNNKQEPVEPESQSLNENISEISDQEIVVLLESNSDAKEYMQSHPDFIIQNKEILTKDSIITGQNGQEFKEVYQGLELEEGRYIKINLMNLAQDRGLVGVIDFKESSTKNVYGIMVIKAGIQ